MSEGKKKIGNILKELKNNSIINNKEKVNENRELENQVLGIIDSKDTLLRIVSGQEQVEFFEDWIEEIYVLYEEGSFSREKLVKQWWVSADQFDRLGSLRDRNECLRNMVRVVCEDLGWL